MHLKPVAGLALLPFMVRSVRLKGRHACFPQIHSHIEEKINGVWSSQVLALGEEST